MRLTDRTRGNGSGEAGMIDTSVFGKPAKHARHCWMLRETNEQRMKRGSLEVDDNFKRELAHLERTPQPSLRDRQSAHEQPHLVEASPLSSPT